MLIAAYGRYNAGTMTKAKFEELEIVVGFNANPSGLLASQLLPTCASVNLVSATTYDWVHNMLQNGVFTVECEELLRAAEPFGVSRTMIQAFLGDSAWEYPQFSKSKTNQLHRIFDKRRIPENNPYKIKASCSELLGVYGLLRLFFETKLADVPELNGNLESFKACCHVLDAVCDAKTHVVPDIHAAARLEQATVTHLRRHQAVYGDLAIKPKHHWQLDVPDQIRRDGMVLDAFIIERTHLTVKRLADHVTNTTTYEKTLISGLLTVQLQAGRADRVTGPRLIGTTSMMPGTDVAIADKMVVWSIEVCVGDVVVRLNGGDPGVVVACAQLADGSLCCFVSELTNVGTVTDCSGKYRNTSQLLAWTAMSLKLCRAWRLQRDGCLFVVYQ